VSTPEPTRLGDYVLLEKLGQGGMATVYRGERTGEAGFRKQVAIKRMIPQYRHSNSLLERFAAEARTNARLDHPNLVAVVDFGIEPEPYLVMEFVEGVTLALLLQRLVKMGHPLELSAACFIAAEAAQGLDHAHRKRDEAGNPLGIVHRDVSPQNILLSNEGAVKVSDFGLVKAADNVVQTGSGIPIGKLSYMAPEQADHAEVDARADVWGLGVLLWEMLAMRVLLPPNDPARATHLLQTCDFPPPSKYRPEIPAELDQIVMACLTKDPTVRTPSAQQLGMSLREVLHEVAPGYGREQLARLLGWVFPEYGWTIDEPHAPAKQPSREERASMPPAPAVRHSLAHEQRGHAKTQVSVQRADPLVTGPHPPITAAANAMGSAPMRASSLTPQAPSAKQQGTSLFWIGLIGIGIAVVAVITLAAVFFLYSTLRASDDGDEAPPAPVVAPMRPSSQDSATENARGMMLESPASDAALYRGRQLLGRIPIFLTAGQLEGGPLVVLAPGHHPAVLDSGDVRQRIERGNERMVVPLIPTPRPERAVLVQWPRPAQARMLGRREALGEVPGLLLLPPTRLGGAPMLEIIENGLVVESLPTAQCDPTTVCVIGRAQ